MASGELAAQNADVIWLEVESNLPSSLVLVDSTYLGRADGTTLAMPPHADKILLVPVDVGAWNLPQPTAPVTAEAGDTLRVVLDFPHQYRIDTVPFGATVSVPSEDDRVLGTTPLVFTTETPLRAPIALDRTGYARAMLDPGDDVVNRHSVVLEPVDQGIVRDEAVEWQPRSESHKWINWAAAGMAVAGGALAVHFKFKADDYYDEYLETGDPALRDEVNRYDTYSYIALGGMQVGIGVLVFRLAF